MVTKETQEKGWVGLISLFVPWAGNTCFNWSNIKFCTASDYLKCLNPVKRAPLVCECAKSPPANHWL